jgi:hypothetical protein
MREQATRVRLSSKLQERPFIKASKFNNQHPGKHQNSTLNTQESAKFQLDFPRKKWTRHLTTCPLNRGKPKIQNSTLKIHQIQIQFQSDARAFRLMEFDAFLTVDC